MKTSELEKARLSEIHGRCSCSRAGEVLIASNSNECWADVVRGDKAQYEEQTRGEVRQGKA